MEFDREIFAEIAERKNYYINNFDGSFQKQTAFARAIDRMLYCNVRGFYEERDSLFIKINTRIQELKI